jgi:hypothetical protein
MKAISTLLAILAATSAAQADEVDDILFDLRGSLRGASPSLEAPVCSAYLQKLRDLRVPASRTLEVTESTDFISAGVHGLPAVRKACDALAYASKVAKARTVLAHAIEFGAADGCAKYWPDIVAAGVRTTTERYEDTLEIDGKRVRISGTLEELKNKACDGVVASRDAKQATFEAPYRKALESDKLAIFLDYRREHGIVLGGGDDAENPAKIAKARTWYTWRLGNDCADGRTKYIVRRYDFDGEHRIAKQSVGEYCGAAVYK